MSVAEEDERRLYCGRFGGTDTVDAGLEVIGITFLDNMGVFILRVSGVNRVCPFFHRTRHFGSLDFITFGSSSCVVFTFVSGAVCIPSLNCEGVGVNSKS